MQRKFSACPSDPFGLRKIKAFVKSDRSSGLPEQIIKLIITFCIDQKHRGLWDLKLPRIETDAFQSRFTSFHSNNPFAQSSSILLNTSKNRVSFQSSSSPIRLSSHRTNAHRNATRDDPCVIVWKFSFFRAYPP